MPDGGLLADTPMRRSATHGRRAGGTWHDFWQYFSGALPKAHRTPKFCNFIPTISADTDSRHKPLRLAAVAEYYFAARRFRCIIDSSAVRRFTCRGTRNTTLRNTAWKKAVMAIARPAGDEHGRA